MTQPQPQPNPNELLSITREELERCCSQMSAAGYKVSANYVEAMVLSRSRPHTTPAPEQCENRNCLEPGTLCPYWESPIGDHGKGTCQFDFGDCRYPDNPEEWGNCMRAEKHDAAVARAATLAENKRVLDELEQHTITAGIVGYNNKGKICNYRYINPKRVLQKINSLRRTAQEQQR